MELKDMQDLNIMPTLPGEEPPEPPEHREEPKQEPPRKEPKKRRSVLPGILVGVAAAAAVLCAYRFIHIWSDASCDRRAECIICGQEREGYAEHTWNRTDCETPAVCAVCGAEDTRPAGHSWTGGSCTEPKVCADCGAQEILGHSYELGVCSVCGAVRSNGVIKWKPGNYTVEYSYRSETRELEMDGCSLNGFEKMNIAIRDWNDETVSTDGYTVSRSDTAVTIHMPEDLEPGRYTICAGVQGTQVLQIWWGTTGDWMPDDPDQWYTDFKVQHRQHGLWLSLSEDGAELAAVQTEEEAARFESPWRMTGSGKLVVDGYVRIGEDGQVEAGCAFRDESGMYLALDAEGQLRLTDAVNEECIWNIPSHLG